MQFSMSSYKPIHHAFDYNYIQTSGLVQENVSPLFLESYNFRKKNSIAGTGRRWKKQLSSCTSMTKTEPDESSSAPHMWTRESGLTECVKTAGKFPWARSNWKLIIFSLCFLSGGGSARIDAESGSVMGPGGDSWKCLRRRGSVIQSRCEVELRLSGRRVVWDLSAGDCVCCEFLVRAWKCFECAELIEYSVYQGCVCASWGFVVLPALPP